MDESTQILIIIFCSFSTCCLCCFAILKYRAHLSSNEVRINMIRRLHSFRVEPENEETNQGKTEETKEESIITIEYNYEHEYKDEKESEKNIITIQEV
jgi:hypothetical protein